MSDNSVDVVLLTDDDQLRSLVAREKPPDATLRCITSTELNHTRLPSGDQYWLDLDSGIAPEARDCHQRIYFCSQLPTDFGAFPTGLLLRKPCAAPAIAVLWASVIPASVAGRTGARDAPTNPVHDRRQRSILPTWLLELHELDLHALCRNCVRILPEHLGYDRSALYLHDAEQQVLTLAESNSVRRIDLAVPLTADNDHPLARVANSGEPLLSDDMIETCRARGMRPLPDLSDEPGSATRLVPLMAYGKLHGLIWLSGRGTNDLGWTGAPLDGIFEFLAQCVEHARRYQTARIEARVDRLTGLFNDRWMMEALGKEIHRSQRYGSPLALIMLDLDGLKAVNDRFGHPGGDALLRHTAGKVSAALRQIDSAARVGGDEFVVLLPATLHNAFSRPSAPMRR
jgi:GGDEF domain-containing protein